MKITDIKEKQPYIYQRLLECSRFFYKEFPGTSNVNNLFTWAEQFEGNDVWGKISSGNPKDFTFFYNASKASKFNLKDKVLYSGTFKEFETIGKNKRRLIGRIIGIEELPLPIYTVKYSNGVINKHTGHCIMLSSEFNGNIQNNDLVMVHDNIPNDRSTFYFKYPVDKANFLAKPQRIFKVYIHNGKKALRLDCGVTIPSNYATLHKKETLADPRKLVIESKTNENIVTIEICKEVIRKAQLSIYRSPTANCQVASLSSAQQLLTLLDFNINEQKETIDKLFSLSGKRQLLFDIRNEHVNGFKTLLNNTDCKMIIEQPYVSTNTSKMVMGLFKKQ